MLEVIIDVREPFEFESGHVKGAINLPPPKIMEGMPKELADVPKDTQLVVYCRSGTRSNATIPYLQSYGFTNIMNGINKDHVEQHLLRS
jgi:phage shock protein E